MWFLVVAKFLLFKSRDLVVKICLLTAIMFSHHFYGQFSRVKSIKYVEISLNIDIRQMTGQILTKIHGCSRWTNFWLFW